MFRNHGPIRAMSRWETPGPLNEERSGREKNSLISWAPMEKSSNISCLSGLDWRFGGWVVYHLPVARDADPKPPIQTNNQGFLYEKQIRRVKNCKQGLPREMYSLPPAILEAGLRLLSFAGSPYLSMVAWKEAQISRALSGTSLNKCNQLSPNRTFEGTLGRLLCKGPKLLMFCSSVETWGLREQL